MPSHEMHDNIEFGPSQYFDPHLPVSMTDQPGQTISIVKQETYSTEEYSNSQFSTMTNSLISETPLEKTPAPRNKRKHNTLTLSDKYGIILRLDQGESSSALCKEFNIGRSTLYDIKTHRAEIEKFVNSSAYVPYDRKTLKKGDYPDVEEALFTWYTEEKNVMQITGDLLKEKGKYFFNLIHKRDDFQASEGWLDKFKKRFGIRLSSLSDSREPFPADFVLPSLVEGAADNGNRFLSVVEQDKLHPDQVYFAFGGIMNCSNLPTRLSTHFRPQIKEVAFMPCINVTGRHKLDLLVVGNSQFSSNLTTRANYILQQNIEISAAVIQEWYLETFIPSVMKYLKKQNLPKKALLIVANVSSFPDEGDMKIKTSDGLMDIMFLPQFSTDIFQSIGLDMNSTLKMIYKTRLLMDFLSKPFTPIEVVMQRYAIKDAVCNLVYAWERLPPSKLADYWLQIWPVIAYSSEFRSLTDNRALSNVDAEIDAAISLFCSRHIPGMSNTVTPEELKTWLTVDFKREPHDLDVHQASADNILTATVSCDDAVAAANTLLQWAEEYGLEQSDVLALKRIQEKTILNSFHLQQLAVNR